MNRRASGILLHITSLPSSYGIGDFGTWAYKFAEFLSKTKQSFWQILPINPTDSVQGNSPYSSTSTFAIDPMLMSPETLIQKNFLTQAETEPLPNFPKNIVDYDNVRTYKWKLWHFAYQKFRDNKDSSEYDKFCQENSYWLEDFALFNVCKKKFGKLPWCDWPDEIRDRKSEALNAIKIQHKSEIEMEKFIQYILFNQWQQLKCYCNQLGIRIIGDLPMYVCYDSCDVWTNPDIFKLNSEKKPSFVAGVPPDYFSRTGQLWGNPVYNWEVLKEKNYSWWLQRIAHTLKLFDVIRLDHFRGFVAYWEVPSTEKNAIKGRWVKVPTDDFFNVLLKQFSSLPFIAEDLGIITDDVKEVKNRFGFPGMKVLLFAFNEDNPQNQYLPHNYERNCVVYTGTHDTNTINGWLEKEASPEVKKRLCYYIGQKKCSRQTHWQLIRLAMMSVANLVIIPMQDILGLGSEARMNHPAELLGNWRWRILPEQLISPTISKKLLKMTRNYNRCPSSA